MRWTALLVGLLMFSPLALATVALADPVRPILKLGAQGTEVTEVQALLKLLGYYDDAIDGRYAESTLIAVTRFQEAAGLSQDGILGTQTWAKLLPAADAPATPATTTPATTAKSPETPAAPKPAAPKPAETKSTAPKPTEPTQYPILRKGAKGDAVVRVQVRLRSLGFLQSPADGDFGVETEQALKAAQQQYKLDPDGVVGDATWRALKL